MGNAKPQGATTTLPLKWLKTAHAERWQEYGITRIPIHCWRGIKRHTTLENDLLVFKKVKYVSTGSNPKGPLIGKWTNKWYISMASYSAVKRNELSVYTTSWLTG